MLAGASPRHAAGERDVPLKTSSFMRHRPCEAMASTLPGFEAGAGCRVEADETLAPGSLSGDHARNPAFRMPGDARGRGGDGVRRGVGDDEAGALTLVSGRGGAMLAAARRGGMGAEDASRALAGRALEGAVVSTDMLGSHKRAPERAGAAVHGRFPSKGSHAPLNHVNAPHASLKTLLRRLRGVSARRLPNHLVWLEWTRGARRADGSSISLLCPQMGCGAHRTTWRGLWRTPCPFHPGLDAVVSGLG